jgi:hypothetical protein
MKFGLDQIGKEPPKWLKMLSDIAIIILGAFAVYVLSIPDSILTPDNKNFIGATATFLVSILKGIEMLSGKQDQNNQQ